MRRSNANKYHTMIAELSQLIKVFKVATRAQLYRYIGTDDDWANGCIEQAIYRNRFKVSLLGQISVNESFAGASTKPLWVYLELKEMGIAGRLHSSDNGYVACSFVSTQDDSIYQILHIRYGESQLVRQMLLAEDMNSPFPVKRIAILDSVDAVEALRGIEIYLYCTVDHEGKVTCFE